MPVSNSFVDLDLSQPPAGLGAGLIPQSKDEVARLFSRDLPSFEKAMPGKMVPRSQWKERAERTSRAYRATISKIYNQGQEGSCVGFGSAQMLETTLRRRYGIAHWVSLSGMSIYKRIGSSAQSGAMISDGMDAVMEGALPADTFESRAKYPHVHPYTGFSKKLPEGWRETAKLFRGSSFAIAEGPDEVASALLNGFLGIVGRQGHCIPYVYLDTFDSGGGFCAAYANSWGDWGDEGFGYDSERIFGSVSLYVLLDVVTRPDLQLQKA